MKITQRIAFKLALSAVSIALVVSSLFGALQVYSDYTTERDRTLQVIGQLLNAYEPAAQRAIHNLDSRLASEVANGMLTYDYLTRVTIADELGNVLGEARRENSDTRLSWTLDQISERSVNVQREIAITGSEGTGLLTIEADMHKALQPVVERAGEIITVSLVTVVTLVVLFFAAYHFQVTRPLSALSAQFKQLDLSHPRGVLLDVGPAHKQDELGELANSAQRFVQTVQRLLLERDAAEQELRRTHEHIEYLAYHDALTELPNRNMMHDHLEVVLESATTHGHYSALVFVDLDNFKTINDSLGHPAGDHVLKQVAQRLRKHVRGTDMVARMGGDEFVICLTNLSTDREKALELAENRSVFVRQALTVPIWYQGHRLSITASVGIALLPDGNLNASDLLRNADIAMYAAKTRGKNTQELFHQQMTDNASRRMVLENDLRAALADDQFFLVFQPQVDIKTGAIIGAEALLRWLHPTKGIIQPMEFIPTLESTGMIRAAGDWVFQQAFKTVRGWQNQGIWRSDMRLGINVSAAQFSDSRFSTSLQHAAEKADIDLKLIDLEITESMLIESVDTTIERMHEMRQLGTSFSIDDFGTGYSSLVYLKRLPVDVIKIDQGFVRDVKSDPNDAAIVETIIAVARHLGLTTIAEGVETEEQLSFLRDQGCQRYQGYLFSRPIDTDAFSKLLRQQSSSAQFS